MNPTQSSTDASSANGAAIRRRRIAVVGTVLLVAAAIQWNRQIGLWILGHWHHWQTSAVGIDIETARSMIQDGAILVDVREPEEFDVSHLAGAISVPLKDLQENGLPNDVPRDWRVITYCTIGRRSGVAAKRLSDDGISAYNLVGGILQVADGAPDWIEPLPPLRVLHIWSDDYAWLVAPGFSKVSFSGESD